MTGNLSARSMIGVALVSVLASALITALILGWPRGVTPTTEQAEALPPAVPDKPSVIVPPPAAKAPYVAQPKTPQLRKKTKLPPALFDGPENFILATGQLDAEERPYTLSSVLDRRTGETQVYAVADPLPVFSLSDRGSMGVFYGVKGGDPVFRATLSQEVFRVKAVRAGATASLDSDGEWFAGLGAEVKW